MFSEIALRAASTSGDDAEKWIKEKSEAWLRDRAGSKSRV